MTTATRTVSGVQIPEAGRYEIDASHSEVGFVARHLVVAKVRGRFADVSGAVVVADDPTESSVEVSIATASVDTRDEQRDAHLRSPDFFDVESYPTMTYRSTAVRHVKNDQWQVDGELTLHGVTQPVALAVTFEGGAQDPWGNSRAVFSARAEIDREQFGLTWNQQLETGGVLVSKKIVIEIEAEAVLQA